MYNTERTAAKQKLLDRIAKAEIELENLRGQLRRIESQESNERGAISSVADEYRKKKPDWADYESWIDRLSRKTLL